MTCVLAVCVLAGLIAGVAYLGSGRFRPGVSVYSSVPLPGPFRAAIRWFRL